MRATLRDRYQRLRSQLRMARAVVLRRWSEERRVPAFPAPLPAVDLPQQITVAFVFEIFYPTVNGIITASVNLAENLIAHGHRVIFIAPQWDAFTEPFINGTIPVHYIASTNNWTYPGMRNVVPWNRRVEVLLRAERVNVVHATGPWLLTWAVMRAAQKRGIPVVQTFHTMLQEPTYIRYFTGSEALVPVIRAIAWRYFSLYMRRSDMVTGPSQHVVDTLREHYRRTPIVHIPNGIDLSAFAGSADYETLQRRFPAFNRRTVVFIGRLGPEKSVDILIDAIALARARVPDLRLFIIGDGPGRTMYERQVTRLGLGASVVFTGRLLPDELRSSGLIHHARANVTASTTESFGMTVIEAMACGTPSIVPDVPGISELTVMAGVTFPRDDRTALARAIEQIVTDDAFYAEQVRRCSTAVARYDGANVAGEFEALYRHAIAFRLAGRAGHGMMRRHEGRHRI